MTDLADYRIQYCDDHPLLAYLRERPDWDERDRVLHTHRGVTRQRMDDLIAHMDRNSNGHFEAVRVSS